MAPYEMLDPRKVARELALAYAAVRAAAWREAAAWLSGTKNANPETCAFMRELADRMQRDPNFKVMVSCDE